MRSLQARLLIAAGILVIVAVAAVAIAIRQGTRTEFRKFQQLEQQRSSERPLVDMERIAAVLDRRCCDPASLTGAAGSLRDDQVLLVIGPAGDLVASGGPGTAAFDQIHVQSRGDDLTVDGVRHQGGTSERVTLQFRGGPAASIRLSDGTAGVARVIPVPRASGPEPGTAFLGSVDRRLLAVTALVGLLTLGATWAITRRLAQPIADLGMATRAFAKGDLTRRVEASGTDEVADLGRSFNRMADALERQQRLRRDLVHDVAHELRTPLTALRCRLETIADGLARDPARTLAGAGEEVQHLSRLVDDLQELALAEAGELALTIAPIAGAEVVRSALRVCGLEQDPRLHFAAGPDIILQTDAVRLRQILINLLTNADRHTPADGRIDVGVTRGDGLVALAVRNTGSSLDDEQLSRVFDRFYRGDPARQRSTGGSGLGLAIVKHLAEALGGGVQATSDGASVTMTVTLPGR